MTTLLLAEHDNSELKDATHKSLTAIAELGGEIHVLVAGHNAQSVADSATKLAGVAKVLYAENVVYENQLAEPMGALIYSLAGNYDYIIAPATVNGKNILPRVAALLDVMQVSDITAIVSPDTFERPIYAGNAMQTVQSSDAKKVITIRTAGFSAAEESGSAPIENVTESISNEVSTFKGEKLSSTDRPELTSARVIISGGRALGSARI